jgi:hypothetical protein
VRKLLDVFFLIEVNTHLYVGNNLYAIALLKGLLVKSLFLRSGRGGESFLTFGGIQPPHPRDFEC